MVVFWNWFDKKTDQTDADGQPVVDRIPFLRHYNIFSVQQCTLPDGIVPTLPDKPAVEPIAACESIVDSMSNKPKIGHNGYNRAYYRKATDSVHMPDPSRFDSQVSQEYDGILKGTLTFSVDGQRVMYVALKGDQHIVIVDNHPGPEYDGTMIGAPIISPDGKRVAYGALKGEKWLVVVDGQPAPEYDAIYSLLFSPDSKRVAYTVRKGDKVVVVVDGQPRQEYDEIRFPVFSPDSKRVAYGAMKGHEWIVIVGDQVSPEYEGIMKGGPAFHSDGSLEFLTVKEWGIYRVTLEP